MNEQLKKLISIAEKKDRIVLGLMSGTSLDGLDLALCKISGAGKSTTLQLLQFETLSYEKELLHDLKKLCFHADARLEDLCTIHKRIAVTHAKTINDTLVKWKIKNVDVDLIASHGQTIFHQPNTAFGPATLQLGDGDIIAHQTGIITLSDFRQKNISAGGEGAPLAAYGDYLLFQHEVEDRILINIGGISNLTFIPANAPFEKLIATDIGPGNKLMDLWMEHHFEGMTQDTDARLAASGKVNYKLLNQLHSDPFFDLAYPKSTGPELFGLNYILSCMDACECRHMRHEDVLATLNLFTANCIFDAVEGLMTHPTKTSIFISGGGSKNPLLMSHLQNHFSSLQIGTTDQTGIPSDAKEAILFALLANENIAGNTDSFGEGTTFHPAVSMGKISWPY